MANDADCFSDVGSLLRTERPKHPVYCIFPHVFQKTAEEFLDGFPGRVLFAVKANPDPTVLGLLTNAGVCHFDCASLSEIELVDTIDPDAKKYFMTPARIRGAAGTAHSPRRSTHPVPSYSLAWQFITNPRWKICR
jgi:ornithine decarboxylase